jgi:hypothetical protein
MWIVLLAIGLLAILSIIGAFFGAQDAKIFFNSVPLVIYWFLLAILFIAGFIYYPALITKPASFAIHLGCLLVILGGMWGSESGHRFYNHIFHAGKIARGFMLISQGDMENKIASEDFDHSLGQLPFSIKLNEFRLEYYPSNKNFTPTLDVTTKNGRQFRFSVKEGQEFFLGESDGKIKVLRIFKNFKIRIEGGKKVVTDENKGDENHAIEVQVVPPDANSYNCYVFERFGEVNPRKGGITLSYELKGRRIIKDYISDVSVLIDGKEALKKAIEVNHPLHFGGYHFYQYSYDMQSGKYTILLVASDNGLYIVYGGFWLLCIGLLWQFWFRHIPEFFKGNINK